MLKTLQLCILVLFNICFVLAAGGPALADKRVALVIGNSAYQNVVRLKNPINDAEAVARLFRDTGFVVVEAANDLTLAGMRRVLRKFSEIADEADIAVVYYAGHGIEVDGTNYLIPIDATLENQNDVEDESISLDRILKLLDPVKKLRLVILDACRDNPFTVKMKRSIGTRSISRGLAKVEPQTTNTLIAFAAKAGSTASEGKGENSPFALAVIKYLPSPGVDLRIAFGRVRDEVLKTTDRTQEPFLYGSLGGEIMALVPQLDPDVEVKRDYEFAAQIGTKQAWTTFLAAHSNGYYADLAKAQSQKLGETEQAFRPHPGPAEGKDKAEPSGKAERLEEVDRRTEAAGKTEADKKVLAALPIDNPFSQPVLKEAQVAMDPTDVARLLQAHLRRVGCDPKSLDGKWDDSSVQALTKFNKGAGTAFDVKVASLDALNAARSKKSRICPLECGKGQRVDDDRCVAVSCDPGFLLNSDGICHQKTKAPKPVARMTRQSAPRPAEKVGNVKCFTFNGSRFCE